MEDLKKLQSLPLVTPGKDLSIPNIPFLGNATFKPVIIQNKGNVPNPFYGSEKGKTVGYYLDLNDLKRKSPHKNSVRIKNILSSHPSLNTPENLELSIGKFGSKLKQENPDLEVSIEYGKTTPAWKSLSHDSGSEEEYVNFEVKNLSKSPGLYIWVIDNEPKYVGIATGGLHKRINTEYGNITTYQCSIDGQSQSCSTNAKLRDEFNAKKNVSLYVLPIDIEKWKSNTDFIKVLKNSNFKGTRTNKNVLEIFEKFIIEYGNFKDTGWNKRMEEGFIERFQKLAGII